MMRVALFFGYQLGTDDRANIGFGIINMNPTSVFFDTIVDVHILVLSICLYTSLTLVYHGVNYAGLFLFGTCHFTFSSN